MSKQISGQASHPEHRQIERGPIALNEIGDDLAHHRRITSSCPGWVDEEVEIRRVGIEL
jgi:hypothetical protein